ncbi:MAG: oxidoreductase [Candidimonas sp.]|nr:MAG: oxidoreductase [Candidimonas sp.]TAM26858.1 MAG: oxidoreductase [Candidimonas sp.]
MSEKGYPSFLDPATLRDPISAQEFMVRMILNRAATATLVKVVKCTNNGGLSPVGFVDVQPLVNQVDGDNQAMPHGVVYGLPYSRLQGGENAIIIDPEPGDIGMAAFASHDISSVKASKNQANPGSSRRFDMADGMYFGGMLNGTPSQYIQFSGAGITITSPNPVTVNCTSSVVNASQSATVTSPSISLGAMGQTLLAFVTSAFMSLFNSHEHTDPQGGTTGVPIQQMNNTHMTTTVKGG